MKMKDETPELPKNTLLESLKELEITAKELVEQITELDDPQITLAENTLQGLDEVQTKLEKNRDTINKTYTKMGLLGNNDKNTESNLEKLSDAIKTYNT